MASFPQPPPEPSTSSWRSTFPRAHRLKLLYAIGAPLRQSLPSQPLPTIHQNTLLLERNIFHQAESQSDYIKRISVLVHALRPNPIPNSQTTPTILPSTSRRPQPPTKLPPIPPATSSAPLITPNPSTPQRPLPCPLPTYPRPSQLTPKPPRTLHAARARVRHRAIKRSARKTHIARQVRKHLVPAPAPSQGDSRLVGRKTEKKPLSGVSTLLQTVTASQAWTASFSAAENTAYNVAAPAHSTKTGARINQASAPVPDPSGSCGMPPTVPAESSLMQRRSFPTSHMLNEPKPHIQRSVDPDDIDSACSAQPDHFDFMYSLLADAQEIKGHDLRLGSGATAPAPQVITTFPPVTKHAPVVEELEHVERGERAGIHAIEQSHGGRAARSYREHRRSDSTNQETVAISTSAAPETGTVHGASSVAADPATSTNAWMPGVVRHKPSSLTHGSASIAASQVTRQPIVRRLSHSQPSQHQEGQNVSQKSAICTLRKVPILDEIGPNPDDRRAVMPATHQDKIRTEGLGQEITSSSRLQKVLKKQFRDHVVGLLPVIVQQHKNDGENLDKFLRALKQALDILDNVPVPPAGHPKDLLSGVAAFLQYVVDRYGHFPVAATKQNSQEVRHNMEFKIRNSNQQPVAEAAVVEPLEKTTAYGPSQQLALAQKTIPKSTSISISTALKRRMASVDSKKRCRDDMAPDEQKPRKRAAVCLRSGSSHQKRQFDQSVPRREQTSKSSKKRVREETANVSSNRVPQVSDPPSTTYPSSGSVKPGKQTAHALQSPEQTAIMKQAAIAFNSVREAMKETKNAQLCSSRIRDTISKILRESDTSKTGNEMRHPTGNQTVQSKVNFECFADMGLQRPESCGSSMVRRVANYIIQEDCKAVTEEYPGLELQVSEDAGVLIVRCSFRVAELQLPRLNLYVTGGIKRYTVRYKVQQPRLGWVSVLESIRKKFAIAITLLPSSCGVAVIIDAWARTVTSVICA